MPIHDTELSRLLKSARNRLADDGGVDRREIELRWGEELGYSIDTVRNWLRSKNPKRPSKETLFNLTKLCLKEKAMDRSTAERVMQALPESKRLELLPMLPSSLTKDRIVIFYIPSDQPLADFIVRRLSKNYLITHHPTTDLLGSNPYPSIERFEDELKEATDAIGLHTAVAAHDELFNSLLADVQLQFQGSQLLTSVIVHDGLTAKVNSRREHGFQTVYLSGAPEQRLQALDRLEQILRGEPVEKENTVPAGPLEREDLGAVPMGSPYYIERTSDRRGLNTIRQPGCNALVIKGPRQVGKTSLLWRVCDAARQVDKRVVELSFQHLLSEMDDLDHLLYALCAEIMIKLQLEDKLSESWDRHKDRAPGPRCQAYLLDYVLKTDPRPLVLAIDEVDVVFGKNLQRDFFGMLRAWVNESRSKTETGVLMQQLDLVLVTSTEPKLFIPDYESPFNIAEPIVLQDFSRDQTQELNQRHGSPLDLQKLDQLSGLLNGHPYLVRRALYLIASGEITFTDLMTTANDSVSGPFSSHLETLWYRLPKQPDILNALKEILRKGRCTDEKILYRLVGAGLVVVTGRERKVQARNKLYEIFLKERMRK